MKTQRGTRLLESGPKPRRGTRELGVSFVFHIALAFALVRFLISPVAFNMIFGKTRSHEVPTERIGFLRLPTSKGPAVEGKSGGDNKPISRTPPVRVVAPTSVPTTIPALPATPAPTRDDEGGSGPLVGGGGPTRGIRPIYTDPRVWAAPGDLIVAPKSAKEKLDSAIVSIIQPFNDSIAVASGQRKPGDWTFEKDGKKYGIDPQFIRLGKFSIPTAVLAMLPINQGAGGPVNDRNRAQNQLRSDIFWQAQRGMNEVDFKKAVKSIRERKERERAAAEKTRQAQEPAASPPQNKQ